MGNQPRHCSGRHAEQEVPPTTTTLAGRMRETPVTGRAAGRDVGREDNPGSPGHWGTLGVVPTDPTNCM